MNHVGTAALGRLADSQSRQLKPHPLFGCKTRSAL
jgi:hypothetical protein